MNENTLGNRDQGQIFVKLSPMSHYLKYFVSDAAIVYIFYMTMNYEPRKCFLSAYVKLMYASCHYIYNQLMVSNTA